MLTFAFTTKGLSADEYATLLSMMTTHLPCAVAVIKVSTSEGNNNPKAPVTCKSEWHEFLSAVSTSSPVCALIHPSKRVSELIAAMSISDITKDAINLKRLQEEIPVVFQLIRSLGHYPKEVLVPIIQELLRIAFATFSSSSKDLETVDEDAFDIHSANHHDPCIDLTCYPALPQV